MKISLILLFVFIASYCFCQDTRIKFTEKDKNKSLIFKKKPLNLISFNNATNTLSLAQKQHYKSYEYLFVNKSLILMEEKEKKDRVIPLLLGIAASTAAFAIVNRSRQNRRLNLFAASAIGGLAGWIVTDTINSIAVINKKKKKDASARIKRPNI